MTIKMRLDTASLRALIADNPELEVEIGREVRNNIKQDFVMLKTQEAIEACLKGMMEKSGVYYDYKFKAKDPKLTEAIWQAVNEIADAALEERIRVIVREHVRREIVLQREELKAHLVVGLRELFTPEMAKELVREKILL